MDELVVVKLGGTTLVQPAVVDELVEVAARRTLVVVHGGGKRLSEWLGQMGVETRFEEGRRVTDDRSLEVAVAVLRGLVNSELVAQLHARGAPAVGLSGVDGGLLVAERAPRLGRVATVIGARPAVLYALFAVGMVPVVAPIAADADGVVCNVNADEAAAGLAGAMEARLVLLTDSDGVRDTHGDRIPVLTELDAEQLITEGVISGGMLPKVRAALGVLRSGSPEVVIADGAAPSAVARALDDPAFGTRFVSESLPERP